MNAKDVNLGSSLMPDRRQCLIAVLGVGSSLSFRRVPRVPTCFVLPRCINITYGSTFSDTQTINRPCSSCSIRRRYTTALERLIVEEKGYVISSGWSLNKSWVSLGSLTHYKSGLFVNLVLCRAGYNMIPLVANLLLFVGAIMSVLWIGSIAHFHIYVET